VEIPVGLPFLVEDEVNRSMHTAHQFLFLKGVKNWQVMAPALAQISLIIPSSELSVKCEPTCVQGA